MIQQQRYLILKIHACFPHVYTFSPQDVLIFRLNNAFT